jgi:hypothetical protein
LWGWKGRGEEVEGLGLNGGRKSATKEPNDREAREGRVGIVAINPPHV